jgi:hypothetical protein
LPLGQTALDHGGCRLADIEQRLNWQVGGFWETG